jgi:predicted dehydrogenase
MSTEPIRVASIGLGWWSDVLADAAKRSKKVRIVACFTRSEDKRRAFAEKYGCRAASKYEEILAADDVDAIINTTPNQTHLETVRAAAQAGKHTFLDKPIATTIGDGRAIIKACRDAGVLLAVGYQRRRENHFRWIRDRITAGDFGNVVQAEANISRDREGKFDTTSWRYTAAGMPGGVMLQIGVHYTDVLEMLLGPVKAVSGMTAQLALPGENPDVAGLLMQHESGAVSTLNAGYASASEYYLMNIYGREMSAYYSLHEGLKVLKRHTTEAVPVPTQKNDTLVEELEEFADAVRGKGKPEVDGEKALRSLAVIRAGVKSAREGRHVTVDEILAGKDD